MSTQDDVYSVLALEFMRFFGGADAAGESNLFDAALSFEAVQLAEVTANTVDSVLTNVAGVEDHEVGIFVVLDLGVACVPDHPPHPVGVMYVHLAAKSPYTRRLWRISGD